MTLDHIAKWAGEHPLSPIHVDCATAVMLKILDGKCKMKPTEKVIMGLLYDQVKHRPGELLGDDIHRLIATSREDFQENSLSEETKNHIYEKRVLAETMISRPVMKGFKSMIRQKGLLANGVEKEVSETSSPSQASGGIIQLQEK